MELLIFYLLLALVVSFFCSIAEAVLLSVRSSYIASLDQARQSTKTLIKLQGSLDRPLAAILTANTIAHTVGAAGVGAQSAIVFGNEYLGVTSAILTLLVLLFSEIIPKTVGAVYWKQLAPAFGIMINWLTILLLPVVWMSEKITRMLSKSNHGEQTFSRSEVEAMVEIGKSEGVLDDNEHQIVSNLMKLRKLSIRDIMTPRTVIFYVSETMCVEDFFNQHSETPFSRIPVMNDNKNIDAYVLKSDLLMAQAKDEFTRPLSDFRRDFHIIPQTNNASKVYEQLIKSKAHIALVVDEYGTVQGLVTQEDIIETLIGLEIVDEKDMVEDMQIIAQDRWKQRMQAIGINPKDLVQKDK